MKFSARVWEVASKDKLRPVLTGVWFDAEAGTLTATDSYCAAVVPCEVEDGDESGLIPAAALKASWAKGQGRLAVHDGTAVLQLPDGAREWKLLGGQFPDVVMLGERALEVASPFGINPDILDKVAAALGAGGKTGRALTLHPAHPLRPIRVETSEGWGIVMPVRLAAEPRFGPDFADDGVLDAAIDAALRAKAARKSKAKVLDAFRAGAEAATLELAKAVTVTTA